MPFEIYRLFKLIPFRRPKGKTNKAVQDSTWRRTHPFHALETSSNVAPEVVGEWQTLLRRGISAQLLFAKEFPLGQFESGHPETDYVPPKFRRILLHSYKLKPIRERPDHLRIVRETTGEADHGSTLTATTMDLHILPDGRIENKTPKY